MHHRLKYPHLSGELVEYLEGMADIEYQRK